MEAALTRNAQMAMVSGQAREAAEWLHRSFLAYGIAADKDAERERLRGEAELYGLSLAGTSFYRRLEAWRAGGPVAALPPRLRKLAKAPGEEGKATSLPPGFVGFWHELCFQSQRVTSAAYRALFHDWLMAGKVIPGYDTDWRGILARDFPDYVGDDTACPFKPYDFTPVGWGDRNLARIAPSKAALTAARIGTAEASALMPEIPQTRYGLPFGSVWVIDDRIHDQLVSCGRNITAREVAELGGIELLTGYYIYGMVPALESADGTKQMLKQSYTRYLMAAICCVYGVSTRGCMIAGENATARLPIELQELLHRLTGGLLRFKSGTIQNNPIAKGLWNGSAGGTPLWKAPLESIHSLFKNEMAMIPGAKGADPEHCPESLAAEQRYHQSIMKAGVALAMDNPDVADLLRSGFPRWEQYRDFIATLYDRVNRREHHRLEGWERCGFMRHMVRLDGTVPVPESHLLTMPEGVRAAWAQVLNSEPARHSLVKMSPAQAFVSARQKALDRGELLVLPMIHVPEILGRDLGQELKVRDDRTMTWKDPLRLEADTLIHAMVKLQDGSRHPLPAGSDWLVHVSPFDSRTAFVSRTDGAVVGTATIAVKGTKLAPDEETISSMKRLESQHRREWARIGQKRLSDSADMIGSNLTAFEAAKGAASVEEQKTQQHSDAVDQWADSYKDEE